MNTINPLRFRRLRAFLRDENGAITVDFVVLTGAVIALVLVVFQVLTQAVFDNAARSIVDNMATASNNNW